MTRASVQFRILFQDEFLVAVDKPAGFQVHQPEDQRHRVSRSLDCLFQLGRQLGRYLHPVHRLDRATSGVLLFALDPETARASCELFQAHRVRKSYYCVARGWTDEAGSIDRETDGKAALTRYQRIGAIELPYPVGPYASARYTLLRAEPASGRMHQIRRHLAAISHPLIGDTIYGDGKHNRFFKETLTIRPLLLRAHSLELEHPRTGRPLEIRADWRTPWHRIFDLFGICPRG